MITLDHKDTQMQTGKARYASQDQHRRRSEATRARILAAAREAFATLGYERATVRKIAQMADIHASMVMRYFFSKEQLFTAASVFDLRLPDLCRIPSKKLGKELVRIFLDRWESGGTAGDLPALLRLSVTHPDGREKAIAIFTEQVKPAIERVARSGDPSRSATLVATQLVGIAFLRYVLRVPAVVNLTHNELVTRVGRTLQAYLDD
jgi:AcrR family transcriptional regulator